MISQEEDLEMGLLVDCKFGTFYSKLTKKMTVREVKDFIKSKVNLDVKNQQIFCDVELNDEKPMFDYVKHLLSQEPPKPLSFRVIIRLEGTKFETAKIDVFIRD